MIKNTEQIAEEAYTFMMQRFEKIYVWPENVPRITWQNENEPTKEDWRAMINYLKDKELI